METQDILTISDEFLKFSVGFHQTFKNKFEKSSRIKANSLAFHALLLLQSLDEQSLTMSALAERLDITKQQLTKLVNALEEKKLAERIHDQKNRRQVYIQITESGRQLIRSLCEELLQFTAESLSALDDNELEELRDSIRSLTRLLGKLKER